MPLDERTTYEISTRGRVDDDAVERARERIGRVSRHCREPIGHVELRITNDGSHPAPSHARAEATLTVKRGPVRAHAQADTVAEAVDLMIDRLRRRLDSHESRLHRIGTKRRDGVQSDGSWHHGDVEATPRRPMPVFEEPAEVVRRKTFAAAPMTIEEAIFDLEILDHDFYLFEEVGSGASALVSRVGAGYQLAIAQDAVVALPFELPLDRIDGPILLDLASAERLLSSGEQPFVFHRAAADEPGQVLYRRYDGDFGIVELGESDDNDPAPPIDDVHVSGRRTLRFEADAITAMTDAMADLREHPPSRLAGTPVVSIDDLLESDTMLPAADAVVLHLDNGRLSAQVHGPDPDLDLYAEVWAAADGSADRSAQTAACSRQLVAALDDLAAHLADPERARFERAVAGRAPESDGDIETRAAELFAAAPPGADREELLRLVVACIDLTTLAGDDTRGRVRALCAQARRPDPMDPSVGPVAAVCVYPNLVALVAELTRDSPVAAASVASAFPSGLSALSVRVADIEQAVSDGADEIDVVINRAAFLEGRTQQVRDELQAMRAAVGSRSMKVILETGELGTAQAIRDASALAIDAGADWIKTSTGKSAIGATPAAVLAMAEAIAERASTAGRPVGLKVSGGVRTSDDALGYLAIIESVLGAEALAPSRVRFGASGLLATLVGDLATLRS